LTALYNFAYNFAIGAVAYAVIVEVPTCRLCVKTIAMSVILQFGFFTIWQFVVPFIFNPNEANLGANTSFIFGGLSILCWIYLYFYQPKTAGCPFEEIDELYSKRFWQGSSKTKTDSERKREGTLQRKLGPTEFDTVKTIQPTQSKV
jgi:MFS transporter, SP family, general alpha glucoside:H+ symporter